MKNILNIQGKMWPLDMRSVSQHEHDSLICK